jgi:hypothetical protein
MEIEKKMNLDDIDVYVLSDEEYVELSSLMGEADLNLNDDFAFSVTGTPKPMIVLRKALESFPPYVHKAIVAHEIAHITGIKDEEGADRWAVRHLNDDIEAKQFLVDNWFDRHGRMYNETVNAI